MTKIRRHFRGGAKKAGPPNFRGESGSLRVLAGEFAEWMKTRNYAQASTETRTRHIQRFLEWCDERSLTLPMEITQPILERYQRWLYYYRSPRGRPMGVTTQQQRLISLKAFFRWLTRTHRTLFNPAAELELPRMRTRLPQDVLTAPEVEAVMQQPDVAEPIGIRDRAIMETLYSTGMRRHELAALKTFDLDVGRGTVMIRQGKGNKDRVTPIGQRALAWIEKYVTEVRPLIAMEPDEGYLFLTSDGRAFQPPVGLSALVRRHLRNAGLTKQGGCHLFRHAVATLMLENGVDIRFVQELLGHASIETTQIYTKVSIQKLKEIHRSAHPAERSWHQGATTGPPGEHHAELLENLVAQLAQEADDEDI